MSPGEARHRLFVWAMPLAAVSWIAMYVLPWLLLRRSGTKRLLAVSQNPAVAGLPSLPESLHVIHLPGVRYAVDAYVNFCRSKPWVEAMAASLTELFAPPLMAARLATFEKHYPWVKPDGLRYFRGRLTQAPRDSDFALRLVLERCRTREQQEQAVAALKFKCELLWAMLDTMHFAYILNQRNEADEQSS